MHRLQQLADKAFTAWALWLSGSIVVGRATALGSSAIWLTTIEQHNVSQAHVWDDKTGSIHVAALHDQCRFTDDHLCSGEDPWATGLAQLSLLTYWYCPILPECSDW
jgi:hypothetical protein